MNSEDLGDIADDQTPPTPAKASQARLAPPQRQPESGGQALTQGFPSAISASPFNPLE